ncbi:hypothetical protein GE115_10245 [Agromyces sp. CFH 90414]|uniref:Uncharacterized protein n=1 Tax=Agromyces agglutinans TaxID=2662258 RepID=A0A6I2F7K0_9MICO|nr:hypothetical protein [Agromyces agglutinans]MRG60244.1 hypothetical protein [Agromyces agglutinans]
MLLVLGRPVWILPTVVLIVALHFLPMPAIFGRTIDYHLGAVMLLVAGVGLALAAQPQVEWAVVWGVTGTGAAAVTSAYGLYMVLAARATMARHSVEAAVRDRPRLPERAPQASAPAASASSNCATSAVKNGARTS